MRDWPSPQIKDFKMAHMVEEMAYVGKEWGGETPWHSLGYKVAGNLTAHEMLVAAKCDWEVEKCEMGDKYGPVTKNKSLRRMSDGKLMDVVGDDWEPLQNEVAFDFFREFVDAGDMTMETAGSLREGQYVWALAKVNKSFTLFGGDRVESYLLFTNTHRYGKSIDVRFTPTRVVCNNTLTMALNGVSDNAFKSSHRVVFDATAAKQTMGIANEKFDQYGEAAAFLGSKRYSEETVKEYFNEVFPVQVVKENSKRKPKEASSNATLAVKALAYQPGVEFGPGTWWQALNAVTYVTDHLMGRTDEARVENMWYGQVKDKKLKAFSLAVDMANKA